MPATSPPPFSAPTPAPDGGVMAMTSPPPPGPSPAAPPPPPAVDGGVAPDAMAAPNPAPRVILRAKEINADRVRARMVFAKSVVAAEGKVEQVIESKEVPWDAERGEGHINLQEVVADEIYVKELRCRRIEADQVHAQQATIVIR
ncbi:MAG TPA: hypothetical protein VGG33_03920 [Polyangia bacterium]